MNQQVLDSLIAALKSGKYEKCERALRSGNRYCTEGVLCDLYRKETGKTRWRKIEGSDLYKFGGNQGRAPLAVRQWADISEHSLAFIETLNDMRVFQSGQMVARYSFEDIAKQLEVFRKKNDNGG